MYNPVAASFRRSPFQPIDADFYVPQLPVSIISNQSGAAAQNSRALLESCGCTVHLHGIGTPLDFLKVIGQGESAPRYLLIHSHGLPEGLYFGEYEGVAEEQVAMLRDGCLSPEVILQHVNLPSCTVLNLSCHGGNEKMVEAFMSRGIPAYIGSDREIGVVQRVFVVNFISNVLFKKLSDKEAWQQAVIATDHEDAHSILFFDSAGRHEVA